MWSVSIVSLLLKGQTSRKLGGLLFCPWYGPFSWKVFHFSVKIKDGSPSWVLTYVNVYLLDIYWGHLLQAMPLQIGEQTRAGSCPQSCSPVSDEDTEWPKAVKSNHGVEDTFGQDCRKKRHVMALNGPGIGSGQVWMECHWGRSVVCVCADFGSEISHLVPYAKFLVSETVEGVVFDPTGNPF